MKKEQEIATNTSSGAEKVETIEKEKEKEKEVKQRETASGKPTAQTKTVKKTSEETQTTQATEISAKGAAALGGGFDGKPKTDAKKPVSKSKSVAGKAEKESAAAKARVEAALKRKQAQEQRKAERKAKATKKKELRAKRMAEKKAQMEKRAAEKKARIEKRAAERKALTEQRKAKKEEKLRERAHAKANKNRENSRKRKEKQNKGKGEKRDRQGYGGWIAAVVSLGVVTLALATTVTVGAMDMKQSKQAAMTAQKSTMYELTGIMEHVDDDLERVRISASPVQQSRILTDLLVQARLAELDLEKLPFTAEQDSNITSFINRTAAECERMLAKLRNGEALSEKDKTVLAQLYEINHAIRTELETFVSEMRDEDLMQYMKEGKGNVKDAMERLEQMTLEENRATFGQAVDGKESKGMPETLPVTPTEQRTAGIDAAKAEELCYTYFSGYNISEYQCVGETVSQSYSAYNIQGYDDKGTLLFAEISQADGALLRFDYYEDCSEETFDLENAERIAEQFLEALGYDDMEVVRFRNNGTTTDFTFLYEDDGIVYYPDEIRVKVCRTRGVVTGMDATKYILHHNEQRSEPQVKINLATAKSKLYDGLTVESSRLAVVRTIRGERAAYEFLCSYGEENYFVFLDAVSGEEIAIVNARGIE